MEDGIVLTTLTDSEVTAKDVMDFVRALEEPEATGDALPSSSDLYASADDAVGTAREWLKAPLHRDCC
jgi:hypothetical protein